MRTDTTFLRSCIDRLGACLDALAVAEDETARRLTGEALASYFEVALEQSGKLLRKRLAAWFASNRQADRLHFKDLFRHAAKHDLITPDAAERWLGYRDAVDGLIDPENDERFDAAALELLASFLADAKSLADMLDRTNDE